MHPKDTLDKLRCCRNPANGVLLLQLFERPLAEIKRSVNLEQKFSNKIMTKILVSKSRYLKVF